jgi:hypothetical protein
VNATRKALRVGDVTVTCVSGGSDERSVDGPVTSWCDSDAPEHYLARRLWETSSGGGRRGFLRSKLEATFLQRGAEGRAGTPPPGLPRLFFADTWCRRIPVSAHHGAVGEETQEHFIGGWGMARRRALSRVVRGPEHLGRTDLLKIAEGWYEAGAWSEKPSGSLLEAVLLIARMEGLQPGQYHGKSTPGRFRLGSREVESRIFKDSSFHREYAADPWALSLDGLPWTTRWEPLFEMQLPDGRARGDVLECGPGPLSPSPMPPDELPDRLGLQDIMHLTRTLELEQACGLLPLPHERPPTVAVYRLTLQLEPDGRVGSATLSTQGQESAKGGVSPKHLQCLEEGFRKLRFPAHRLRMDPVEVPVVIHY